MHIGINFVNLLSKGTLTTGLCFLEALSKRDDRYNYTVIVPSGYGYEKITLPDRIKMLYFKRRMLNSVWRLWFDFITLPGLVNLHEVDVMISLGNHCAGNICVPKIVRFCNTNYTDWEEYEYTGLSWLKMRLERFIFGFTVRSLDLMVAQSSYTQERLISIWGLPKDKIRIIPNALSDHFSIVDVKPNVQKITKELEGKFGILYVSRYYPYKNHISLIKAAKYFKKNKVNDIIFILTIDSANRDVAILLSEIEKNNVSEYFANLGDLSQPELSYWYKNADCMIFPSLLESFGNPLVEAMAFQLPICAIDLTYARTLCDDSAVYFKKDDVEDTVKIILELKNSQQLRKTLSEKGLKRYGTFPSYDEVVNKYIELAEEVLSKKRDKQTKERSPKLFF